MKEIHLKIEELGNKDSEALRAEYKEWLEAGEVGNKHPHVLYMNLIKPKS
tara:strand:- start:272 stop:421 length:150 start_codon:yes stop_codon:yes gene_type:complete